MIKHDTKSEKTENNFPHPHRLNVYGRHDVGRWFSWFVRVGKMNVCDKKTLGREGIK